MKTTSPWFLVLLVIMIAGSAASCKNREKENLAAAQRAFDRLEIGMNKQDTCWNFGVTCDDSPDLNYEKDYGMSFSRKEYMITIRVRNDQLVRVELSKPYYEGRTRISGQGKETIIAEKGLGRDEIN